MKKVVIACMVLFVVAALTAPAQALPICFKWVNFCDGVGVDNQGVGGAYWYHFDCANNSTMDASPAGNWVSNCPNSPPGVRVLRSLSPHGPGDWYFIVETPTDGTTDMHQGVYPNGVCWINDLAYNLLMGVCTGDGPENAPARSSIQEERTFRRRATAGGQPPAVSFSRALAGCSVGWFPQGTRLV